MQSISFYLPCLLNALLVAIFVECSNYQTFDYNPRNPAPN